MLDFFVVGSGISGSTIAYLLSKRFKVEVFDKAKGSGGRSSNKKLKDNLSFDHGLQYISPKSKLFQNYISKLTKKKILKIWDGNHLDFTFQKESSDKRYIGFKGNNDLSKYHLKNIKQNYSSEVESIKFNNFFWEIRLKNEKILQAQSIIFTCPFPQLKRLANKYLDKRMSKLPIKMEPNITTMVAFKNQKHIPISSIKFNDETLAWAAHENSKNRFKSSISLWTLQSSVKFAKKTINLYRNNKKFENILISKFLNFTGYEKKKIIFKKTHGWKYSFNYTGSVFKSYWNKKYRLGVCADWFIGPKAESAWISANDLFKKIQKKSPR